MTTEPGTLRGRDLLSVADLSAAEVQRVFATTTALKAEFRATRRHAERLLDGRTLALGLEGGAVELLDLSTGRRRTLGRQETGVHEAGRRRDVEVAEDVGVLGRRRRRRPGPVQAEASGRKADQVGAGTGRAAGSLCVGVVVRRPDRLAKRAARPRRKLVDRRVDGDRRRRRRSHGDQRSAEDDSEQPPPQPSIHPLCSSQYLHRASHPRR